MLFGDGYSIYMCVLLLELNYYWKYIIEFKTQFGLNVRLSTIVLWQWMNWRQMQRMNWWQITQVNRGSTFVANFRVYFPFSSHELLFNSYEFLFSSFELLFNPYAFPFNSIELLFNPYGFPFSSYELYSTLIGFCLALMSFFSAFGLLKMMYSYS